MDAKRVTCDQCGMDYRTANTEEIVNEHDTYNPIINALISHIRSYSPQSLTLAAFVHPNGTYKDLGVTLRGQAGNGRVAEITSYTLSPDERKNFARYVDEARAWLETLVNGVPADHT
jgi:uncharacterized membrane protein